MEKTTEFIPFVGDDDGQNEYEFPDCEDCEEHIRGIRFKAYRKAWTKCLDRIQYITRSLLDPIASQIVEEIEDNDVLPGLPRDELPVITVTNPVFRGTFLYDIAERLDNPVVHLHPSDCLNVVTGMRGIVSGFVEGNPEIVRAMHKTTTSLANYDIQLLAAWYKHYRSIKGDEDTRLLVVLHDFEAFTPTVMQDIFYIYSQHLADLPLVFILSMSSPVPSYLNVAYPRSTLTRLRIRQLTMPGGVSVLNSILLDTFFSVDFQPDIVIGPIALQFIADYYTRWDPTLDALITNIQLIYMKHFINEPITALAHSTPSEDDLVGSEWASFVEGILTRLTPISKKLTAKERDQQWKALTTSNLPDLVETHRSQFRLRVANLVLAFNVMKLIQLFLVEEGYKGLGWKLDEGLSDILVEFLQNNVDRDIKDLSLIMRKLGVEQLDRLLPQIHEFLSSIESDEGPIADASSAIHDLIDALQSEERETVPQQFSEWGTAFFK
ncbi:hypothetical protein CC2G_014798 [Coprinopsis cinerea AmutBmut pab1-1]|nr:hypothetical protein CC2G_014798 [Coprinopsis cinerea AmutBmut pab1-1]